MSAYLSTPYAQVLSASDAPAITTRPGTVGGPELWIPGAVHDIPRTPADNPAEDLSAESLTPLDPVWIPEKLHKHVDPSSPPPMRLMAARAMVPMGPRDMVHVVYQCMLDPEPKIAAVAPTTGPAMRRNAW